MTAPTANAQPKIGLNSQFAPSPTTIVTPFPAYAKGFHGFAEIKKHNIDGIRGGLEQLADHWRAANRKSPPEPTKRAFLITYRYKLPVPSSGPMDLDALVLEPKPNVLANISPIITDRAKGMPPRVKPATKPADPGKTLSVASWLDGLGTWYSMGSKAMTTFSSSQWLSGHRAGGSFLHPLPLQPFGHMAEVVMRDWFLNMLDQNKKGITDITQNPLGSGGADVSWQEIAEYLYELANELAVGAP